MGAAVLRSARRPLTALLARRAAFVFAALAALAGPAAAQETPAAPPSSPAAEAPPAPPEPPPGPLVRAVEIRSDGALEDVEGVVRLIAVEAGKPLADEQVRRTLRNLQASGRAAEIELSTRPAADGAVDVVVVLWQAYEVEEVRLEGSLGLNRSELSPALDQAAAQPLSESRVLRTVYQLQDLYRERGYLQATVRTEVVLDDARKRAVVLYRIESGPRATVAAVDFVGDTAPFAPFQLLEHLRVKPGEPYSRDALRDDAERLQRWLIRQGHALARVDPPEESSGEGAAGVRLFYPIQVGPRLEVEIAGAERKKLERRGLLPFLGDEGYDEALVLQAEARLKEYYQQQGHYKVRIETDEQRREGVLQLAVTIDPGPEYRVESVDFTGNATFGDEQLAELMTTSRRRLLALGSGRLVQDELDADLDNLRSWYALQGFAEAEVGPADVLEEGDRLRLTIPIVEGPRREVARLTFEGVEKLGLDRVGKDLPLAEGGPFHPVLLEQTLDAVRARYAAEGYALVQVSARVADRTAGTVSDEVTAQEVAREIAPAANPAAPAAPAGREDGQVAVAVSVLEGPQVTIDRVIVRGARRTEDAVIERTIDLDPGDPVSQGRLLEVERSLYQLGIFSRVDAELARSGLDDATRDVVIRVEEGLPRTLTYGLGYDTEDGPRGLLGYTHNNVGGRAYTFRSDLRVAERDSRVRVLFDQPYLGEHPVALTSVLLYELNDRQDRTYSVERLVARSEAVRLYGKRRASLGLEYRWVETQIDEGTEVNEVERRDFPYQLASLIPTFFWDRRDDPLSTTDGWSALAQLQYAFPAFTADAEFLKLFVQYTHFLDLGRPGVLAGSLRVGGIEPFAELEQQDPYVPDTLPSSDVFIDERFFAGGDASHRAYERDQLGIRGQTLFQPGGRPDADFEPAGGNGLLLFNLEYRFPLFGAFGGAVFSDTGNVWADWRDIDPGDFKAGIGFGLRYLSPIGPLRFDLGWKLDREPGESNSPVYFLSFGNPF